MNWIISNTILVTAIHSGKRMEDLLTNTNPYQMFAIKFWIGATIHPNNTTIALRSLLGIKS